MSNLREYLLQKRVALLEGRETAAEDGPHRLQAKVTAEGRSGVRRIRIREHQILSDSDPEFAGYNFGPGSPELQLGVLGSCLAHIFLIQAADRQVPLDSLEVEVSCELEPRAGQEGFEHVPRYPHNIEYTVHLESPASAEEIASLHTAVEAVCPVLNLLINPQEIKGTVALTGTSGIPTIVVGAELMASGRSMRL